MNFTHTRVRVVLCVLPAAALIALAVAVLLLAPERVGRRPWKKHYTLYIEDSARSEQLILQIADSRRFQAVVSRYTTDVSFNTFAGFTAVPIHRLSSRLDPLDPRFDPYLQRVHELFSVDSGRSWEVVYLRSDRNVLSSYLALRALMGKRDLRWRLGEFNPPRAALRILLLLVYLIAAARLCSHQSVRLAVGFASLPWLALVAVSDYQALLAFFLVIPAWANLFEQIHTFRYEGSLFERPTATLFTRPLLVSAAAVVLAVAINRPGPYCGLLLAVVGGLPAAAFLYAALILRDSQAAHVPFRPLPILRRFRLRRTPLFPSLAPYVVLVSIALCSYPVLRLAADWTAPAPKTIRMYSIGNDKGGLSWSSLSALRDYPDSGEYPNLADYLTHRAFQESLMFGRPYEFPRMGERILVSDYRVSVDGARVLKTFRVVKQFKESWLSGTLEAAPPGSVPRLFADQGFAGAVGLQGTPEPAGRYGATLVLVVLFLLQFLIPRYFNLTASALYATRSLTLRRH